MKSKNLQKQNKRKIEDQNKQIEKLFSDSLRNFEKMKDLIKNNHEVQVQLFEFIDSVLESFNLMDEYDANIAIGNGWQISNC